MNWVGIGRNLAFTAALLVCATFSCQASATSPTSLEMSVPFEPTAFPSAGRMHLFYELHLKNGGTVARALGRIEVLDAEVPDGKPIAVFEGATLDSLVRLSGHYGDEDAKTREIPAGASAVIFLEIAIDQNEKVPDKLFTRVISDSQAEGLTVGTRHTELRVLGPPVRGSNWLADDGPGNDPDNHHRRGVAKTYVLWGRETISRRYAIDWMQIENGSRFSGDAADNRSYYAYGKDVLAVADGKVIAARSYLPDNVPRHDGIFRPAIPIVAIPIALGNTIVLDIGGGQFAYYFHLRPGSLRVKAGDQVRRGQVLAQIGTSGDARGPHLHFELTNSPDAANGEGIPYLIDHYTVTSGSADISGSRTNELPLDHMLVDFGADHPH